MKSNILHIFVCDDITLCGYAEPEVTNEWLDIYAEQGDEKCVKEIRERIDELKQDKFEFGSNCKGCISILRRLRKIRK